MKLFVEDLCIQQSNLDKWRNDWKAAQLCPAGAPAGFVPSSPDPTRLLHPSEGNISSRTAEADKNSVQLHNCPIHGSDVKSDYSLFKNQSYLVTGEKKSEFLMKFSVELSQDFLLLSL